MKDVSNIVVPASHAAPLIRQVREAAGITQVELAKRMGTKQSAISRLEDGSHSPTIATLRKVAKACGVPFRIEVQADQ